MCEILAYISPCTLKSNLNMASNALIWTHLLWPWFVNMCCFNIQLHPLSYPMFVDLAGPAELIHCCCRQQKVMLPRWPGRLWKGGWVRCSGVCCQSSPQVSVSLWALTRPNLLKIICCDVAYQTPVDSQARASWLWLGLCGSESWQLHLP